ncbi:MAG: hypothetical protein EAY81_08840 [Bacteroidetes bacterium]|nr:MAG: hypothetical protein EAY81_08840 [Bacteroidota bacterium]
MRLILLLMILCASYCVKSQHWLPSAGLNLVGPSELFDVHANIRLKSYHHFLLVGATWRPTTDKFALIDDLNYLVFPIQYQYHFYINRKIHLDANAGMQALYIVSRYLPNQLKITPVVGLSLTQNFNYNCFYIRGGINVFVPRYFYADRFEAFAYSTDNWLLWPQLSLGKYLH